MTMPNILLVTRLVAAQMATDAAKTLTFGDGGSLAVSALSYASSTTKNNITSTIVGSGRAWRRIG